MFNWLDAITSLPNFLPLVLFAGVMIALPTLLAVLLRIRLYAYLSGLVKEVEGLPESNNSAASRRTVPGIVKRLERRFQEASIKLDRVNTPALIDGLYTEERFSWLGLRLQCENVEYFSRALPNLLLNFGLLGTFLGISINLIGLNQQLTETQEVSASQATDVIQLLQGPLEGMSIAFMTSLAAVFCSSMLVLVNIFWNTGLLRNKLISSLEDYLDNTLHPEIDNRERLDKAISQMVSLQRDTLSSIETAVRDQVEHYLHQVATTIAQAHVRSAELAEQIYERFLGSADVLSLASSRFDDTLNKMTVTMDRYDRITQSLDQIDLPQRLTAAATDLSEVQGQFSTTVAQLQRAMALIESHSETLHNSSQSLSALAKRMGVTNQDVANLLEQGTATQASLTELVPHLSEQVNGYREQMGGLRQAVLQLFKLEEKIEIRSTYLENIQAELTRLIEVITMNTTERDDSILQAQARLDKRLEAVVLRLERGGQDLRILRDEFTRLVLMLSQMKEAEYGSDKTKASLGYMLGWFRPKQRPSSDR